MQEQQNVQLYFIKKKRQVNHRNGTAGKDLQGSHSSSLSQTHNPLQQTLLMTAMCTAFQ